MTKLFNKVVVALCGLVMSITAMAGGNHDHDFPVGAITQEQVLDDKKFNRSYQAFELTDSDLEKIQTWGKNVTVDVYFGMWCHDSQREVPRLLKILESNGQVALNMVALDIKKSDPEGLAKQNNVKYTPTIIVSMNGAEVGRIIEYPETSLVADIHKMLAR